ncbi:hypothetical protein [Sinosporangium siamense]|uniref:Cytochrome P450 n=1 Tax=Sinosporangium siamense TaxID=1367973 RepID=A0A919RCM4_9ACTN|nr:hypothetical protein [Sinosporangium siamense]GII90987.1 hypothetical protein Ssi02_12180 [Sinosporangium siamense]
MLDAIPAGQVVDLIDAYAFPLPLMVICELMGIPLERRDDLRDWSVAFTLSMMSPADNLKRKATAAAPS